LPINYTGLWKLLKPTPKHMNRKNKIKAIMPIQKILLQTFLKDLGYE
jgi:hypothetical protein